MTKNIALFSPYSPDLGGGSTNLRSLIPHLEGLRVRWLYTAARSSAFPDSVRVGPPMAGGPVCHDLSRQVALWSGLPTRTFHRVISDLTDTGSSGFWIVGHNEGVMVARALARRGARVHLTIQDDVPEGIFARSRRYRPLVPLVRATYEATLRRMASIDVTSDGMQAYYREKLGLSTVVIHPFVAALPASSVPRLPLDEIRVGHIGSVYSMGEWRAFVVALGRVARKRQLRARMLMVGLASKYRALASEFPDVIEIVDDLPEAEAVERLSTCHFLYAMYPFDPRSDVFRRTSLPTKVTTYLKCLRPILAHAPEGSTLLDLVDLHHIGVACSSVADDVIEGAIERAISTTVPHEGYERTRQEVYGIENAERLRACLEAL